MAVARRFRFRLRNIRWHWIGVLLFTCVAAQTTDPKSENLNREDAIKAGFLIGFTEFVSWHSSLDTSNHQIVYATIGENSFSEIIRRALRNREGRRYQLSVRTFESVEELEFVEFLLVNNLPDEETAQVIQKCQELGILSVSDREGFAKSGGIIEFFRQNNRIKLKMNLSAAKKARIRISSKLIRLAEEVGE